MECKIGEIFEYNSDWYQCIRASKFDCFDCDLGHIWNCKSKFPCEILQRKDGEQVIFKKLEKVGEPYQYIDGIYQEYKATLPFFIRDATYIETVNGFAIKIKQNKEDMEEKKIQHYDCFFDREPSKSNSKPFDLEAAKSGKPVCTRNGQEVRIICFDAKLKNYPIVALVKEKGSTQEYLHTYTNEGRIYYKNPTHSLDLVMPLKKKTGWVNIYRNAGTMLARRIYNTRKEAMESAEEEDYIDTVRVVWYK